jgi:hypothetical protein
MDINEAIGLLDRIKGDAYKNIMRCPNTCAGDKTQKYLEETAEALSLAIQTLQEVAEGLRPKLPVKVGDTVYIITEAYFDCENCQYGAEARYDKEINRVCCKMEDRHCPYNIEEHIVQGFNVGERGISGPGEWNYEGLEVFAGVDGKWHPTREQAEKAKEAKDER